VKLKLSMVALFALGAFIVSPLTAHAQEGEPVVVDEVIAQVNDGVITLSMLKRAIKDKIEELKSEGVPEAQAADAINKQQAQLIVTLINGQILLQKGKEMDLADDVEAAVNRRMLTQLGLEVAGRDHVGELDHLDVVAFFEEYPASP